MLISNIPLNDVKSYFPKVTILTHTDLDGYGSAAIMIQFLKNLGYSTDKDVGEIEVLHQSPAEDFKLPENGFVIITDLAISRPETIEQVKKFYRDKKNLLVWIDHHLNSTELCAEDPEIFPIYGIRNTCASATLHCFIVFQMLKAFIGYNHIIKDTIMDYKDLTVGEFFSFDHARFNSSYYDYAYHGFAFPMSKDVAPYIIPEYREVLPRSCTHEVPRPILSTNAWDIHDFTLIEREEATDFNSSFFDDPEFKHDPFSDFYMNYFLPWNGVYTKSCQDKYIEFLNFGKRSNAWKRFLSLNQILRSAFIAKFDFTNGGRNNLNSTILNQPIICINAKGFNFTTVFRSFDNPDFPYKFAMMYSNDLDGKWKLSLYHANEDKTGFDAKILCTAIGGGGHPGCAGAHVTELPPIISREELPKEIKKMLHDEINSLVNFL